MKTLVIIPAYNESESIMSVIRTLEQAKSEVDYIVVNDCSTDDTKKILEETNANFLDLPVNLGIGGGVQAGYLYALEYDYDIAVQMDADGQHDAQYLQNLIQPIIAGEADVVIGSRFLAKEGFQSSALRRFGIQFLSGLIYILSGIRLSDVTSGFRAVNRKAIREFSSNYAQDYPEPEAILTAVLRCFIIKEIPVIMHERQNGRSSINTLKSVYYMIKVTLALIIMRISEKKRER